MNMDPYCYLKNTGQPVLLIKILDVQYCIGSQYWNSSIVIVENINFPVFFCQQYWKTSIVDLQY